jgi:hypothetical protein
MSNNATKVATATAELAATFPAVFTFDPTLVRPVQRRECMPWMRKVGNFSPAEQASRAALV